MFVFLQAQKSVLETIVKVKDSLQMEVRCFSLQNHFKFAVIHLHFSNHISQYKYRKIESEHHKDYPTYSNYMDDLSELITFLEQGYLLG